MKRGKRWICWGFAGGWEWTNTGEKEEKINKRRKAGSGTLGWFSDSWNWAQTDIRSAWRCCKIERNTYLEQPTDFHNRRISIRRQIIFPKQLLAISTISFHLGTLAIFYLFKIYQLIKNFGCSSKLTFLLIQELTKTFFSLCWYWMVMNIIWYFI